MHRERHKSVFYTRSAYTTHDLDFVAASTEAVAEAMTALGFERQGRHWLNPELSLTVELPGSVLHPARSVAIEVEGSPLHIIAVEDLIVDRLAGWIHWGWDADGASAALLIATHVDLDADRLELRAHDGDVVDALQELRKAVERQETLMAEQLRQLREDVLGARSRRQKSDRPSARNRFAAGLRTARVAGFAQATLIRRRSLVSHS